MVFTLCIPRSLTMTFKFIEKALVYVVICFGANYAEFDCKKFVKKINDSVEFTCSVNPHQIENAFWKKDNFTFEWKTKEYDHIFYNITTLKILTIKREDEGVYSCNYLEHLIGKFCLSVEVGPEMSIYVNSNHREAELWAKSGEIIMLTCVAVSDQSFVNISWSLEDRYISFGPTQTTVQDDDSSFITNSSLVFTATRSVYFIECFSDRQHLLNWAASINISTYDMYFSFDEARVHRDFTISSTEMLNIRCVFDVPRPYPLTLKWISNGDSFPLNNGYSNCSQEACIHNTSLEMFPSTTKDIDVSCISVGDYLPRNFSSSITVHVNAIPSIHIMLNGENLTSPLRGSSNTVYYFQCVALGSKPAVNLGWKVEDTFLGGHKTIQTRNEFNNDTYDCTINLLLTVTKSRTRISCFILSPPSPDFSLNITLSISVDGEWNFPIEMFLLLIFIVPIVVGLKIFWPKVQGFMHTKKLCFNESVHISEVNTTDNYDDEFELNSDASLYYETTAESLEKYQHKETKEEQTENIVHRKNVIITSALSGNGYVKYSIGHHVTMKGKRIVICKSVKDDAHVKDVYHFLKMAEESSLLSHHPNIVKFLAISKEEMPFYTYNEHVAGGSVRDYLLRNYQSSRISRTFMNQIQCEKYQEKIGLELCAFVRDVTSAMDFLLTNKFNHPALSARKVLLSSDGCCKLYDIWPTEISLEQTKRLLEKKNPPIAWLAPESIFLGQYHFKSDVWSFGVFVWELYSFGEFPHKTLSKAEIEEAVRNSTHLSIPCNCPGAIINIMLSCWSKDTEKRPSFKEIHSELQSLRHCPPKIITGSASTVTSSTKENNAVNERRHTYFMLNPDQEDYIETT
ncbi:Tyrosine kinase receptor Cad96Ca [Holothuria leucospilota]|uniref:receptor protein-tyrosine kinase n=1 Tax=Holothuria leucospilota TaxID=206669 RepID=A0A9Q1H6V9_HOLLE|nr:Tyrosine kinase receptor Cad96Ca [Holothuria leucospilota]